MKRRLAYMVLGLSLATVGLSAHEILGNNENEIRVVPVKRTPESNNVVARIIFPRDSANKRHKPIQMQMRIEGFPLGTESQFDRAKEIRPDPKGQTIHLVIDNQPYIPLNISLEDSFDENRIFNDKILSYDIVAPLEPGPHVLRTFPARSYGESLKGDGCFDVKVFYFRDWDRKKTTKFRSNDPYLTYNEPQGTYSSRYNDPIMLDFYLTNCELSPDGYKVRLQIDDKTTRLLTRWNPYFIYGLKKGQHKIKLELVDQDKELVPGPFNSVTRTITVK